jgi:hypothetical protein
MMAIPLRGTSGKRVKSVINGETILFVGAHFEVNTSTNEITKYYFAGASRIATPALHQTQCGANVRKYIVPESMTLNYLLGDHLGSTSLAVNAATGEKIETRYKACPYGMLREGEVRYSTPNTTLPMLYTFTGQRSYVNDEATDFREAASVFDLYDNRFLCFNRA